MAKQTSGSKCDTGSKYELSVTTFFASFLSKNENVENYRIFSNFDEAQPFDDIVAEVQFKGLERRQIYAIQIKSGRDKLNVNKYCDGYNKIIGRGGLKFGENTRKDPIYFWYFCSKSPTKDVFPMTNNGDRIDLKLRMRSRPYNIHETILSCAAPYELFSEDLTSTDYQSFLNSFYLFLNQPDTQKVINIIKGMWNIDNPWLILLYVDNYFANTTEGLDKAAFEHELLKIRLSNYIVTPTKAMAFQHNAVKEWNRLTLKQDVTIVRNEINIEQYLFGCILDSVSDLISIDEWNCCVDNVGKLDRDVRDRFKAKPIKPETLRDLIVQVWVDGRIPLLLKVDTSLTFLKTFSHLKKSYIIIDSEIDKRCNEIKSYGLSVFRHLGDVKGDKVMKATLVSLQGRKPVSLYEIIKNDGKLMEAITCLDIISLMELRQVYLKRECLDGNDYMLFVIETANFQQRRHDEQQPNGTNIAVYCEPGGSYEYYNVIRADPKFKSYKIFCLRLTDDNKLVPIPPNLDTRQYKEEYRGLECFFVDRKGENVYNVEYGEVIPIIGEVPVYVRWRHVPRLLREVLEQNKRKTLTNDVSKELSTACSGKQLAENDFFKESNGKISVITGDAGMGKTTILHSLFRFCESKYYVLFVDLVRYQVDLHSGRLKSFQHLLDLTRDKCRSLPYNCLLNSLYGCPNRLVIILDSFDEIVATCKQQVLAFIKNLLKINLHKVIIASRVTVVDLLIETFEAETFKIENLNEQSNEHYVDEWNLNISSLHHIPSEFLTNPLYLNMLRTISENGMNLEIVDRWNLFESVVKLKMENYCRRTCLDEIEKQYILAKHGELALKVMFGPIKIIQKLEQDVQSNYSNFMRLGFITRYDNKNPIFVHHTFVEYFVVKWLIKNIGNDDAEYIYRLMLKGHKSDTLHIHTESFPLHKAILEESVNKVKYLCKENVNCLLQTDEFGRNALHLAAIYFDDHRLRLLDFLIQRMRNEGYDLYACDKIMNWTWVDYFERYGFEIYWSGCKVSTKEAYFNYYATHIEELGKCKFSLSCYFNDCYGSALYYSKINLIRALLYLKYIENKAFVEFRQQCLQSSANIRRELLNIYLPDEKLKGVHLACIYGNVELVKVYIDSGTNFNENDKFNCTPLHYSVIAGQSNGIVKLLLENCEISNSYVGQHNNYTTILHMSIRAGDVDVVEMVLERINANLHNKKWRPSLLAAIKPCIGKHGSTRLESIKKLLKKKDKQLYTPLEVAIKYENKYIVELLLKYDADVDIRGRRCRTPLCAAVRKQNREIIGLLLQHGADPNFMKEELTSPLILAIENGDEVITETLLNHGADVNLEDEYDGTPLHRAVTTSKISIIGLLLRNGANVNYTKRHSWTTLTYAIHLNSSKDVVEMLLSYKADANLQDKNGETPLSMAIKTRNLPVIELLLQNGARADCTSLSTWANRICADKSDNKSSAQMPVNARIKTKGIHEITPLCAAIKIKNPDIVEILLNNRADVNWRDEYDLSPLTVTVETGNTQIAKTLLKNKANVNFNNEFGMTALYVAAFRRNVDMVELLLEYGADVNITTLGGEILYNAKKIGKIEVIVRLLKNRLPNVSNDSTGPSLARNIIRKVAENWAAINLEDELRTAVKEGLVNLKTIEIFKEWGGDIDIADEFWTAVFCICEEMNDEMIDTTVLMIGRSKLARLIRKACCATGEKRNLNIIRVLSRCLLSCAKFLRIAIELNDKELVRIALRNPAAARLTDYHDTPLSIAVRQQNADIVRLLLEHKCAVNRLDAYGFTPLIIAVRIENVAIAEILLAYGADVNCEGKCPGALPLNIAALTENRCMVNLLLKYGAKEDVITTRHRFKKHARGVKNPGVLKISTPNTPERMENIKRIIKEESSKTPKAMRKREKTQEVQTRTTSFGGSNRKAETVTGEKQRPKNQKTPPAWSDQRQQLIDNHSHCFRTIYFKILASDLIVRKARECISQVTLVHFLSDPIISYDNVNVTIRAVNTKVT
ncbi:hypothetical protein Trydic_g18477 [Trypoxylus dichotomus]